MVWKTIWVSFLICTFVVVMLSYGYIFWPSYSCPKFSPFLLEINVVNLPFIIHQVYVFAKADDFKTLLEPLQDVARKFITKVFGLTT